MGLEGEGAGIPLPDGTAFLLCTPRPACTVRGPHGIVPALEVDDIAQAKAHLRRLERPIVMEEVVPGLARLTFLDPWGNAVDLVQTLDASRWQRGARIPEVAAHGPPRVRGLFEVSLYALDVPAAVRFYREEMGLATGLTYFAHIHLLFENLPLVVRPTWHRCAVTAAHTPALVVGREEEVGEDPSPARVCEQATARWYDGEYTRVFLM